MIADKNISAENKQMDDCWEISKVWQMLVSILLILL